MKSLKYSCGECKICFSTRFELQEHKNIHTGEFPFICTLCQKMFSTVSDYVRHFVDIHISAAEHPLQCWDKHNVHNKQEKTTSDSSLSLCHQMKLDNDVSKIKRMDQLHNNNDLNSRKGDTKYFCTQCNIKFDSGKEFSEHKKEVHVFICENCNNRYSSSEKLSKHVCFLFSDGEPFKCSCSLTFIKATQFKSHVGSKPYSCCKCSMQFNRITNLIRHIRTHTKQKPYVCEQCGRGFSQSTNLRNHASIHLGIKAIQCNECDFSCKTLSGLLKHKKKHKDGYIKHTNYIDKRKTSTEIISCPICQKGFPFKRNVGMHMKVHKRIESLCQECGKVFDSKSKLTTHYKACHGVPSICQTCGKNFASSVLLTAHEKTHVSGKEFSCTKCYKTFSVKNYLVQHMKTHLEGKQYSCNKCGKLFKVAVSLKYHGKICTVTQNVL